MNKLKARLSRLSALNLEERHKIQHHWSTGVKNEWEERNIVKLIEKHAHNRPKKIAVVSGDKTLTYQELNEMANKVAHYLRGIGVGAEKIVAISLERGIEQIVWIIGILKSGGCYIPIDPSYPKDRQKYILEDSGAEILITSSALSSQYNSYYHKRVIEIELLEEGLSDYSSKNPPLITNEGNLAYVIYTSGSTGKPKGVMIEHKGLSNLAQAQADLFHINQDSKVLQFAPMSFDASVSEWSTAFISGASLYLMPGSDKEVRNKLVDTIIAGEVTVATLPPSVVAILPENSLKNIKTLVVAGEACGEEIIERWSEKVQLINAYGPTECTVCATTFECDTRYPNKTIGRPISNIEVYILDENLQFVPEGVVGELYLGGKGIARGYLNNPQLTEERFITKKIDEHRGEIRLYKTGDLGRWLSDGNIEYIGREDFQVKIRGYRVELGEIENVLARVEDVREVVVIAQGENQQRLVAYIVPKFDILSSELSQNKLKQELQECAAEHLPSFMVPSSFMFIDSIPLTANGKIDRKSILVKADKIAHEQSEFIQPSTEIEKLIAKIWIDLLQIEKVSINDDFFRLGGDSIISIQLLLRCQKLGLILDINTIFAYPTLKELAKHIEISSKINIHDLGSDILPRKNNINLPLSYAQQRLWFLNNMMQDKTIYNILVPLEIIGELNFDALNKSFQEVLRRHEIFYTQILQTDDQAIQVIKESVDFQIKVIELPKLFGKERDDAIIDFAQKSMKQAFNLSNPPLIRVHLLKLEMNHYVLIITMHHIVTDAWSIDILFTELGHFYNSFIGNQIPRLPDLKIQYADFAIWQREWLDEGRLAKQLSYWQKQLKDIPEKLQLPSDKPRPKNSSYRGAFYYYQINSVTLSGIKNLLRDYDVTLFMFLMAILQILLSRYSNQKDIVVGFPIANRHYQGTENLIGFFVNTLALRLKLEDNTTFSDFLKQVHLNTLEAYKHQDIPFEYLVEQLQIKRNMNWHPVFQVLFGLQNTGNNNLKLEKLKVKYLPIDMLISRFDLTISAVEQEEFLTLGFEYSTDLFKKTTIERMAQHFEELIISIISNPNKKLNEFNYLTKKEYRQFLEWNKTSKIYSQLPVHQLFEERAKNIPDAIAILYQNYTLTYQELNEMANKVAHYLRGIGVGAEKIVAISLERGIEQIVWIIGILKSGGCYIPIDPSYPKDRQKYILEDSGAEILITSSALSSQYNSYYHKRVIEIELLEEGLSDYSSKNPPLITNEDNLAYVIYTSGSTGKPKGVMIEHKGLSNLAQAQADLFHINQDSKVLQFAPMSFDAAIWEWVSALCHGATLITILDNKDIINATEQDAKNIKQVTIATIPPSLAQILPAKSLLNLKTLVIAGEACSEEIIERWSEKVQLINAYGPTECTVCATTFECDTRYPNKTIGRPISNIEVYILDENLQFVPEGVVGELYLGGKGIARGYLNNPQLTEERFITKKIDEHRGEIRLYKTGDLGRWLSDGNIEYIGREDFQVKIRGYRVELGEIENVLARVEDVREVVVIAQGENQQRLVAYIVPKFDILSSELSQNKLKQELQECAAEHLPSFMVPSSFMFIDSIPLTANGKIDKNQLICLEKSQNRYTVNSSILPQTHSEFLLANILSNLLNIKEIDINSDFFALGGDSILSIQYVLQAKKQGMNFSIHQLFDNPTIKALSAFVDSQKNQVENYPLILPQQSNISTPLSFGQQRLWFVEQLFPSTYLYNTPLIINLDGELDLYALKFAFNMLIERHEILRTIIKMNDSEPEQVVLPHGNLSEVLYKDLSHLDLERNKLLLEELLLEQITIPFNLLVDRLMRVNLFKLADNKYILLIIFHHMVIDGWSLGIINRELSYFYNTKINNLKNDLPMLEVQYGAYTVWQRKWLQGERLKNQLNYWQNELKDITTLLPLTTDKIRPKNRNNKGRHYKHLINKTDLERVKAFAEENNTSLFTTLLAALQLLLYRYTNEKIITIGTPIANRHYPGVENTIGFFVNTIALKSDFNSNKNFIELLRNVKKSALNAYRNQDIPFEYLVEHLGIERNLCWNPVFQVMFSLDNLEQQELQFVGLKTETLDIDIGISKFDLSISAKDTASGLMLNFEYAEDLFFESTISRMASHFENLIKDIPNSYNDPVELLNLFSREEINNVLYKWNDNKAKYSLDKTVVQLIEAQTVLTPEQIAITYNEQKITFYKLNILVNQLSSYLINKGVTKEILVPVFLDRSIDFIISILAVLKAGGAYVPLDIHHPKERIRDILFEINSPILITDKTFSEKFDGIEVQIIELSKIQQELSSQRSENPDVQGELHNLAYVIYTSGSTGQPKGVMIEHKSLVNYLLWCADYYPCKGNNGTVVHSSCVYDMMITGLFLPLITGSTIHLLSEQGAGQELPMLFDEREGSYNFIKLTPSHLNMLNYLSSDKINNQAKALIIGGEMLTKQHILYWQKKSPDTILYNEYGPSEATVACCVFIIDDKNEFDPIPIGKPISNTQLYILDRNMKPVGIGIPGELYIGGVGLARGYLNKIELTAESFIDNPFAQKAGEKLYKTGDLARYLQDGNIQFLGRIDNQIKLRGYRIELGEVETVLSKHEKVQSNVVVVQDDKTGQPKLVAYVVIKKMQPADDEEKEEIDLELRSYLQSKLPEYMVPNYFIAINKLPINHNGKLDKNKFPTLENLLENQQSQSVKARNGIEEDLVLLWQELLHVNDISVFDNFFSLGGHSLLMTKVVAYVKTKLGVNLPLRSFFEEPTIANLSAIIKQDNKTLRPRINKNLSTDSILDPAIHPIRQFNYENSPKVILLTGATGFLGAYLLLELCKKPEVKIYCIIRANNISEAQEKINTSCQKYNLNYKVYSSRIGVVLGDLGKANLGLSPVDYIKLSKEVDTIYHNGALVNHILDYNKLRETNVLSTIEIIKFATNLKTKNIHYISTLSNCSLDDNNNINEEFPDYKPHNLLHGGYAVSKWISEILLGQAVARGIPVTIYRPSNITGETKTGIISLQNNHLFSLIKGCIQIKHAPDWDMQLDLNPVDFISQLIIKISLSKANYNKVFNISNNHKIEWKKLISWLQNKGYEINLQSEKKWRDSLINLVGTENPLYPLLSIYLDTTEDSTADRSIGIRCSNTNNFMKEHEIIWPLINDTLLENYFDYLIKEGFL